MRITLSLLVVLVSIPVSHQLESEVQRLDDAAHGNSSPLAWSASLPAHSEAKDLAGAEDAALRRDKARAMRWAKSLVDEDDTAPPKNRDLVEGMGSEGPTRSLSKEERKVANEVRQKSAAADKEIRNKAAAWHKQSTMPSFNKRIKSVDNSNTQQQDDLGDSRTLIFRNSQSDDTKVSSKQFRLEANEMQQKAAKAKSDADALTDEDEDEDEAEDDEYKESKQVPQHGLGSADTVHTTSAGEDDEGESAEDDAFATGLAAKPKDDESGAAEQLGDAVPHVGAGKAKKLQQEAKEMRHKAAKARRAAASMADAGARRI